MIYGGVKLGPMSESISCLLGYREEEVCLALTVIFIPISDVCLAGPLGSVLCVMSLF
jgi:hypothetical protein